MQGSTRPRQLIVEALHLCARTPRLVSFEFRRTDSSIFTFRRTDSSIFTLKTKLRHSVVLMSDMNS